MLIYPAIDLIDGQCVRLTQGDFNQKQQYQLDPLAVAKKYQMQGATHLHIVDLDGAKSGSSQNVATIASIVEQCSLSVQVGGGIRKQETIEQLFKIGVDRVIVGTRAVLDNKWLAAIIERFGADRIIVSVDCRGDKVAVRGWVEDTAISRDKLLNTLVQTGVTRIIFTDILQDGQMQGPNFEAIQTLQQYPLQITVAGGVCLAQHIDKLQQMHISGAIVGKALYESDFDLEKAIRHNQKNYLSKRVIACMDIKGNRIVKGVNFTNLKDAGDPVAVSQNYSALGVDELVFLDIEATVDNRENLYALVQQIAKKINIPLTVGGGVNSLDHIQKLLRSGADKVSIGSAAHTNPKLVEQAAKLCGSQSIVISVDAKKHGTSWHNYLRGGRVDSQVDAIAFSRQMQRLGAGELLVNSLDRDGMGNGFDLALLNAICANVSIPVIASSGAGTMQHFAEVFSQTAVSAALAASIFHYNTIGIPQLKQYLKQCNIAIRI